jgi:hypothetical protein
VLRFASSGCDDSGCRYLSVENRSDLENKREIFFNLLTKLIALGYSLVSVKYFNPTTLPDFADAVRASWVTRPTQSGTIVQFDGRGRLKFFHSVFRMWEFACESDRD